ncbi:MAG: DUF2961 domain-containing protein [Candidatus Sumerlaeota bacterium]|nr:DUF2961 domain-containing protein [Candidatus Sumerlaeota bacterium]
MACQRLGAQGDLASLARLSDAKTLRESSYDRDLEGNRDARPIAPGETLTLGELEGPGAITHLWFTVNAEDPLYPRSLVLRIYWDGEPEPAVESPLGDFFAVGHGADVPVNSIPVQVSSEGRARNCYWRMPFRKSARLTVTNDSPASRVRSFYYYVDYERLPSLSKDTPYFHAQYRQEYPCRPGDYLILDAVGRGHLVGTVLSVWHTRGSWFGEGDDRFYIDGAATPTLHGTGTEDYFSDAWGFRPFNQPYHGVTLWDGGRIGGRGTAYRWHIVDPVRFEESLRFTIEHKGPVLDLEGKKLQGYGERHDCYSSVAFWYQTGRAKRFAEVPPLAERFAPQVRIEGAKLVQTGQARASKGDEITTQRVLGNANQLWFKPKSTTETPWLEVDFDVETDAAYLVEGAMTHSWDYGDYRVLLDGKEVEKRAPLYSPQTIAQTHGWGAHALSAGRHTLRFECVGSAKESKPRSSASPGRLLGLEAVVLTKVE